MGPRYPTVTEDASNATLLLVLRVKGYVPMDSPSLNALRATKQVRLHNSCFIDACESWCHVDKNVSLTYRLPSSPADADDDAGHLRWVLTVAGTTVVVVQHWRMIPEASLTEAVNDPMVRYCRRFELRDAATTSSYHVLALDPATSVLTGVVHMQPDFTSVARFNPTTVGTSSVSPSTFVRSFFANPFIL